LKHVFLNLFNTSFKAMEKGGELTLIARNDGSWIEVLICETGSLKEDVQDTGCQEVYTQPDFIGNSTAIDLSICYSIIQHHRGDLRAENIPGHGARYVLKFPAILD
jgi:two-component system, NtrC family, sensor kinase